MAGRISVTDTLYVPTTKEELDKKYNEKKAKLQAIHKQYKAIRAHLRAAVESYRTSKSDASLKDILDDTDQISKNYFSQYKNININNLTSEEDTTRILKYHPGDLDIIPTKGYMYRDLTFEHNRTTKIPEDVGIVTYPYQYPTDWFFKLAAESSPGPTSAELPASLGPEGQSGGGDGPKKQLSSRQIGAIIAARKARRF